MMGPGSPNVSSAGQRILDEQPDALIPVLRDILLGARGVSAVDAYRGLIALKSYGAKRPAPLARST